MGTSNSESMNEEKNYYPFRYGYISNLQSKMEQFGVERRTTTTWTENYVGDSGVYLSRTEIRKAEKAYYISVGFAFIPILLLIVASLIYFVNAGGEFETFQFEHLVLLIPFGIVTAIVYRIISMPIYKLAGRSFTKSVGVNVGEFDWEDVINSISPRYRKEWIIFLFQDKKMREMNKTPSFIKAMEEKGLGNEFLQRL